MWVGIIQTENKGIEIRLGIGSGIAIKQNGIEPRYAPYIISVEIAAGYTIELK